MPLETRQANQGWLHRQVRRSKALCASAILVATALTALAACGGSSPLADDLGASGDRATQPPSSPSAIPSQDADAPDVAIDADGTGASESAIPLQDAADPDVAIDADTTLSQIVGDLLNASEQACIREELGEHLFYDAMAQPILGFLESDIGESDASLKIFECAPDLFVEAIAAYMGVGLGPLSDDERECLREWVADLDEDDIMVMTTQDDDAAGTALGLDMIACVPDLLIQAVAAGAAEEGVELDLDEVSDDERECLREWAADLDPAILAAEDDAALGAAFFGMFGCVPDLLIQVVAGVMGVDLGLLSDDERECLREWWADLDEDDIAVMFTQDDDAAGAALGLDIIACVPDLLISGIARGLEDSSGEFADTGPDDHADGREDATVAAVDAAIEGEIEHLYDIDFFVFQAEAGVAYQMDVAPETMSDPVITLYDSFEELDYSDDYEGLAPRIHWEAPASGSYYVAVEGFDLGTYTLTIATRT